jgi:hypothetical protein
MKSLLQAAIKNLCNCPKNPESTPGEGQNYENTGFSPSLTPKSAESSTDDIEPTTCPVLARTVRQFSDTDCQKCLSYALRHILACSFKIDCNNIEDIRLRDRPIRRIYMRILLRTADYKTARIDILSELCGLVRLLKDSASEHGRIEISATDMHLVQKLIREPAVSLGLDFTYVLELLGHFEISESGKVERTLLDHWTPNPVTFPSKLKDMADTVASHQIFITATCHPLVCNLFEEAIAKFMKEHTRSRCARLHLSREREEEGLNGGKVAGFPLTDDYSWVAEVLRREWGGTEDPFGASRERLVHLRVRREERMREARGFHNR